MQESYSTNQTLTLPNFGFHLPELMPDEFFLGFYARFSYLNGFKNSHVAKVSIASKFKRLQPELTTVPMIFGIAKIYGMDLNELVQKTTLIPLQAKLSKVVDHDYGKNEQATFKVILRRGVGMMKKHPCLCMQCAKEDTNYWGFSYWRRSHQLPGVDWCTKHNLRLIELSDRDAFNRLPSYFINHNENKLTCNKTTTRSQFEQKFSQLIHDACEIDFTLNHKVLKTLLLQALNKKMGPRESSYIFWGLDKLMSEQLSLDWMKKHFPKLVYSYHIPDKSCYHNMLEACSSHKLLTHYLLMTALIFDNPDEAMLAIINEHSLKSPIKANHPEPVDVEG